MNKKKMVIEYIVLCLLIISTIYYYFHNTYEVKGGYAISNNSTIAISNKYLNYIEITKSPLYGLNDNEINEYIEKNIVDLKSAKEFLKIQNKLIFEILRYEQLSP